MSRYLTLINHISKNIVWCLVFPIFILGTIVSMLAFVGWQTIINNPDVEFTPSLSSDLIYGSVYSFPFVLLIFVFAFVVSLATAKKKEDDKDE